jgi:hypothetical protein
MFWLFPPFPGYIRFHVVVALPTRFVAPFSLAQVNLIF